MRKAPFDKKSKTILRGLEAKLELIRNNPNYGRPIAKKRIPKRYLDAYGITNLFWIPLPVYWRMLYSTARDPDVIILIVTVIEIIDHPTYDRHFDYGKK
ncbi:MAG: hypothetical protein Q8P05_01475 [Candidatus Diapherotrites archaeon]|nr:hypothetical protein [Candidatus Diapherotrites archaeon]